MRGDRMILGHGGLDDRFRLGLGPGRVIGHAASTPGPAGDRPRRMLPHDHDLRASTQCAEGQTQPRHADSAENTGTKPLGHANTRLSGKRDVYRPETAKTALAGPA